MAYSKKEVWNKILKRGSVYLNYSYTKRQNIRKSNGLKGPGGIEDGCISFVAFSIAEGLFDLRLVFGQSFTTKRKSIILHSWKMAGNAVNANIDFIFDKSGQNIKHKIRVKPHKQEVWFEMIRWMPKTRSLPLGQLIVHKSRAMVLIEQKADEDSLGFVSPHYQVFWP